ncbi:MAG: BrnT family toxin [Pseudolabrys sp.]|jgi:uncharacterized DUF497 family protein
MGLAAAGFDWDGGKLEKCRRHGVEIADIEAMFQRLLWVIPAPVHSRREDRLRAIGTDPKGRHIFAVFTLRGRHGETRVRPISARYMHTEEIQHYEAQKTQAEKASRSEER